MLKRSFSVAALLLASVLPMAAQVTSGDPALRRQIDSIAAQAPNVRSRPVHSALGETPFSSQIGDHFSPIVALLGNINSMDSFCPANTGERVTPAATKERVLEVAHDGGIVP